MGPFKVAQKCIRRLSEARLLPTRVTVENIVLDIMALIAAAKNNGLENFSHSKCKKRWPGQQAADYLLTSFGSKRMLHPTKHCPFYNGKSCSLYNTNTPMPHICVKRFLKENNNIFIEMIDEIRNKNYSYLNNIVKLIGGR